MLQQELETARQIRARIDRVLLEQDSLQEKAQIVVEASIWKHIIAQAHLKVLDGKEGVIYGKFNILLGYIGMTPLPSPLYT